MRPGIIALTFQEPSEKIWLCCSETTALLRCTHPRQPQQPPETSSRSAPSRIHLMNYVQTSDYQRATRSETERFLPYSSLTVFLKGSSPAEMSKEIVAFLLPCPPSQEKAPRYPLFFSSVCVFLSKPSSAPLLPATFRLIWPPPSASFPQVVRRKKNIKSSL